METAAVIQFGDKGHIEAIEQACGHIFNHRADVCISREEGGKLLGGVILEGYTGVSIQAHVAGFAPYWLNRDLLWVMFDYPFTQLGCETIFCQMREKNLDAIEFNRKLGFKEVCRIDGVFPDGQCVLTKLTRSECRWLNITPRTLTRGSGLGSK